MAQYWSSKCSRCDSQRNFCQSRSLANFFIACYRSEYASDSRFVKPIYLFKWWFLFNETYLSSQVLKSASHGGTILKDSSDKFRRWYIIDIISSVINGRILSKMYHRALIGISLRAHLSILSYSKTFLKTFLLHQKMNWYFILKKAKSTERHMVQEKSTNINVSVQKKKWEMANAITIRRAISLNAFGMDTTAMIYYHCLLIILINALVIIKGNGWIERFEIIWLWR